jgi:TPR repeat protein
MTKQGAMNKPYRRQNQTQISYPNSPLQDGFPFTPSKKVDSKKKFRSYLRKARKFGNPNAQLIVGFSYFFGVGVDENKTEATRWLEQSASKENEEAQLLLGSLYLAYFQDETKAFDWLLKAAGQKNKFAQFWVGGLYFKGLGVAQNYEEAIKWWEKAAAQGDNFAQTKLGDVYAKGLGEARDEVKAVEWWRIAATQGKNDKAQYRLGVAYSKGKGVPPNDSEAFKWWHLAAKQGHVGAQYRVGLAYYTGQGTPQNDTLAFEWWLKVAKKQLLQKNRGGPNELWNQDYFLQMIEEGEGEEEESSPREIAIAHSYLGLAYKKGQGVSQDDKQSLYWFRKVAAYFIEDDRNLAHFPIEEPLFEVLEEEARQGVATMQVILAHLYKAGVGRVSQDLRESFHWLSKAAQQKDLLACYCLGNMYMEGHGVTMDLEKSVKLFQQVVDTLKQDHLFSFSTLKRSLAGPEEETKDYPKSIKQWIGLLAQEKLRVLQGKIEQQKSQEAQNQMLSYLTHTLKNSFSTVPDTLQDTIRRLRPEYEQKTKLIDRLISIYNTVSFMDSLIITFKLYVAGPLEFEKSWSQDSKEESNIRWVLATALRETVSRILWGKSLSMIQKLLPGDTNFDINALQQSFLDEVISISVDCDNLNQILQWLSIHLDIFAFDLHATENLRFASEGVRFNFFFSIFAEIIYNALKYSHHQKIEVTWQVTPTGDYKFTCCNWFDPARRHEGDSTKKGLVFIEGLVKMLKESTLQYYEENNLFTVKLFFHKSNF